MSVAVESSIASALCGTFPGICSTSPPFARISRPPILNSKLPLSMYESCSFG